MPCRDAREEEEVRLENESELGKRRGAKRLPTCEIISKERESEKDEMEPRCRVEREMRDER